MEERKIIESKRYNVTIVVILSLIIFLIGLSITIARTFNGLNGSVTCRQNVYEYYFDMYSSYGADFAESLALSYAGTQEDYIIKHFFSTETCAYHYNIEESLIPLKNSLITGLIF